MRKARQWRRGVLLLVGPGKLYRARRVLRRLERPTERTPRPHKGSGGGMFFASCSSSSSAIVAAGVQRPAARQSIICSRGPLSIVFRVPPGCLLFTVHL